MAKKTKKPATVLPAALRAKPGQPTFGQATAAERHQLHEAVAKLFEDLGREHDASLADAGLPPDAAEAIRIMLFDHDPTIALESSEALEDIPLDNFAALLRTYKAKMEAAAKYRGTKPAEEWTGFMSPADWQCWLERNDRSASPTSWLRFKAHANGEDHPVQGNKLVRFPHAALRAEGLNPP